MANRYRGTLYIGVTADLEARIHAHRSGRGSAFCRRYRCSRLVHAEEFPTIDEAIGAEKAMKKWRRAWKIEAIERNNPDWRDLWDLMQV
ncbi:GIY-YIG nuclease family protein [Sphingomonas ginkgonis]|uniref:GIY-YIG nuclease family protein n=2 Tax=Sphingomonas ginkgonis TaxID=2315330 RepID=A0A429VCI1_9SPHN|nr:GIY-YIG nuclease family protein [Sphingomonas ginkgonis]